MERVLNSSEAVWKQIENQLFAESSDSKLQK